MPLNEVSDEENKYLNMTKKQAQQGLRSLNCVPCELLAKRYFCFEDTQVTMGRRGR